MNKENKNLEELFTSFEGQWDTEEPVLGHQQRFLEKLTNKNERKHRSFIYKLLIPAAAAVLVLVGILIGYEPEHVPQQAKAKVSPQVMETEMYFTSIIEKELAKVEKENSPETKVLVQDALKRMEALEKDYAKLIQELASKGENKHIINAMITNLQTRISFLQEVLTQIENIKKLKERYNEGKNI